MFHDVSITDVLNGIPHAVVLLDRDLNLRAMNPQAEALTGRDFRDVVGIRADFVLRTNLRPFAGFFKTVFEDGRSLSHEGNILDGNRKIIPVRYFISPVSNGSGDSHDAMMVIQDLSQFVYLEQKRSISGKIDAIVSLSPLMQEIEEQIQVFAGTDATVLIDGETGTGKGAIAETIHKASKRAGYPYIKVNCGALPGSLLESELFGHTKGALKGSDRERQGMLRLADKGTIFFSEIGDMPLAIQAKLLSVLDDGEFSPRGSTKKVAVNVRIIAATGMDLKAMVQEGRFREDLFYRLQVLRLHVPPLRERAEDIPLLVDHFAKAFAPGNSIPQVEPEAISILKDYYFPGNIRELRNIVEHALTLGQGESIKADHIPEYVLHGREEGPFGVKRDAAGLRHETGGVARGKPVKWDDVEKEMIIEALRVARGKRSEAAQRLGWARSTLYRKLKYHGL